jgi:hypothetical protein
MEAQAADREAPVRTHNRVDNTISSWNANNIDASP